MTLTPEERAIAAALAQAERDVACGINPSGEPLRVALHKAMDVIKTTSADFAALRIEHEAVCGLLTHTRKDRDAARAEVAALRTQVAELTRLGASIHKAADAAREAERDRCAAIVSGWHISKGSYTELAYGPTEAASPLRRAASPYEVAKLCDALPRKVPDDP